MFGFFNRQNRLKLLGFFFFLSLSAHADPTWVLGGYLPENLTQKVFLTISGKKIVHISPQMPENQGAFILNTEDVIFPGLVDMHSHIKYNVLPLWPLAVSQFKNRFEWRTKFAAYKNAVSFNMKAIKNDTVCAAVRWAEVKALTGGATSIQGIGGDSKCAADFGIHNLEIPGEYENRVKIRGMTDIIMPDLIGSVFQPLVMPLMKSHGMNYDAALKKVLEDQGVDTWVKEFVKAPHTVANGLKLLIGDDLGAPQSPSQDAFVSVIPKLQNHLMTSMPGANPKSVKDQIDSMGIWLFGKKDAPGGYVRAEATEKKAFEFLGKGGVLRITGSIRRYINMFELSIRQSAISYLKDPASLAIVAHLAEGHSKDPYNQSEYGLARMYGMAQRGLVVIHGVGLSDQDMAHAAQNQISLVWSPFSNLLLYGDTLNVVKAKKLGINVAIGADWSPTGSKTLLDELKIARRFLNKMGVPQNIMSDKDLIEMATINAARAIHRDQVIGRIAEGFQADIMTINKDLVNKHKNPYTALVNAGQADVNLVTVSGNPLYGEVSYLETVAQAMGFTKESLEIIPPKSATKCTFQKALRIAGSSPYDQQLSKLESAPKLRSIFGIARELTSKMAAYATSVRATEANKAGSLASLDPLYNCEDPLYTSRFNDFIEKELDRNIAARAMLRAKSKLDDKWTPLAGGDIDPETFDQ